MSEPPERGAPDDEPIFLVDQNVQNAVLRFLTDQGYTAHAVRDVLTPDSPDEAIAFLISQLGWVLISHDKDFRNLDRFLPAGQKGRYRKGVGTILLQVQPIDAVARLTEEWASVVFHYRESVRRSHRLQLKIHAMGIQSITNAKLPDAH